MFKLQFQFIKDETKKIKMNLNPLGTYLKNLLRMQIKIKYVAPE